MPTPSTSPREAARRRRELDAQVKAGKLSQAAADKLKGALKPAPVVQEGK